MNQFFKFLFASCLGTALALILLFFIGISMLVSSAGSAVENKKVNIESNSVLELKFDSPIPERTNNLSMDPFDLDPKDVIGLKDMVLAINKAKEDKDIKGIYINTPLITGGKATSSVIRAALVDFKSSGKFIYAYAPYYTQNGYYLASVADTVVLHPLGAVDFRGFSSMIAFYKGMLDKLDVQMKIFYAGKFKSATEPFRLDKMSDENRLQVRVYLKALYDIYLNDVAESRHISKEDLMKIADTFEGREAHLAQKAGLVDKVAYEDEVHNMIRTKIGVAKNEKVQLIQLSDYFSARAKKLDLSSRDKIAVLYCEGTISDGNGKEPGTIYDGPYVKMLRDIRNDEHVKALVLRINSPGGSVMASDNILREIRLFKESGRPIIVSMGDVAASGGYYIATAADSIFAEPNTITGSIGVFGMIPVLQKTMKDNLGITFDTVRTGKYSAFGTPFLAFSDDESRIIQTRIDAVYEDFLTKVADGRHMSRDAVNEIAQGRVWPGSRALEIGLVDDLGGLDRALQAAAAKAGLEKYRVTEYPRTKTGLEQFMDRITKSKDRDDAIRSYLLESELGDMYPAYKTMQDMRNARGIQARLPYELIIN